MSVTENLVLSVVATDVFCFEELVWLVWPALEEAVVMGGSFLVSEDLGRVEKEVVLSCLEWCVYVRYGSGLKYVVWVSDYILHNDMISILIRL